LDQVADTPEFRSWLEREFPAGASELADPVSRRHFVKIMSASFMLAGLGLTGCRRPTEKILPFSKMPEGYVHGVPQYFATAMPVRGSAIPLVVKSSEGRPIKVEGNPLHPDSNGGTDLFAQASILDLYDPDRAMRFTHRGNTVKREVALDQLDRVGAASTQRGGEGVCFLLEQSSSPTRERLIAVLREKLPKARWFVHEPADFDIHRRAASLAFGRAVRPHFKPESAKVILSLDGDFLGTELEAWRFTRGFAQSRKLTQPTDDPSRLYAVEALFTLTGANADHRLRVPAGLVSRVAARLAARVLAGSGVPPREAAPLLIAVTNLGGGLDTLVKQGWIDECANDLLAHRGSALVVAGHRQPLEVHLIAYALNVALDAVGQTLDVREQADPVFSSLGELVELLRAGQVDTLVMGGMNPAYSAPADIHWLEALAKVKSVIRLGAAEDETFPQCEWHLPQAHYLESWGDARTPDGTVVPVQPLVEPLYGGVTEIEMLARLGALGTVKPHDLVRETFKGLGGASEDDWKRFLHDGFLRGSTPSPIQPTFDWAASASVVAAAEPLGPPSDNALELVLYRDAKVDDGRFNNNGWLQELPDPVTKMTWENVILLSPATASALGLRIIDRENNNLQVPVVRLNVGERQIEGPAWIQPGMADQVVAVALGYGRSKSGRVGQGTGFNAYAIRTSSNPWQIRGVRLTSTGARHQLATTQNHWAMEGRPVIREANLEQYRKHPHFADGMNMHEPDGPRDSTGRLLPLYPNPLDIPGPDGVRPRDKSPHAWGMAIDLNACTGCSACVVACQSENNVPIVGKDLVARNREMHWLRLDRYYSGPVEDPQMVTQPMMCQHCESAPCESVCPVNATVHDEEGLNVMAYNRCVGTRYCSNNCPYKVRRFNYLDYNRRPLELLKGPFFSSPVVHSTDGEWDLLRWFKNPDQGLRPHDEWELLKLTKNPDVTVRMRGVMEKCTFCLQRIAQAKIARKVKTRDSGETEVPDGAIKTACQQACPAEAIVFGNLNDSHSRVSQWKRSERDYSVLEFLATRPRTTYLARVRNPNALMPDTQRAPLSFQEWEAQGNHLGTHHSEAGGEHGGTAEGHEGEGANLREEGH
jgi:molybdopterin-containing oxidoreductase family iron-sulfur binding subunit